VEPAAFGQYRLNLDSEESPLLAKRSSSW